MNDLAEMIKKHRKLSKLTQNELALLAGVGKTVVYDIEKGKSSIQFDTLSKILSVLNIKIHFISPLEEFPK